MNKKQDIEQQSLGSGHSSIHPSFWLFYVHPGSDFKRSEAASSRNPLAKQCFPQESKDFFFRIKSVSKFWVNLCVPDPIEEIWETSKGKLPLKWPNFIVSFWCQRAESPSRYPSPATLMNKLSIAACIPNQCHGWKSTDHCAFCVDCCVVRLQTVNSRVWSKITTDFGWMKMQLQSSLHWGSQSRLPAIFQQSPSNTVNYTTHRHITTPQAWFTKHDISLPHNCHTTLSCGRSIITGVRV